MKLKKLLKEIPVKQVKGSKEVEITGVCSNSKLVAPGNLFIAKKGLIDDGAQYIPEAIAGGAVAVVTDIYDPSIKTVTQIIHPDVNLIEGLIAAHYYQFASDELFMVGVTGTNGKTTTSFIIKHLLDSLKSSCGLIGTIEYIMGQHRYQATRTTPDVTTNHKMLREMVLQNCKSAVMEVTSHALIQGRVQNVEFDVAVFTNLSLDHLDYHQTMDNYCAAKNKLFRSLNPNKSKKKKNIPTTAIVNVDSPWHQKMTEGCKASLFTIGIEMSADLRATDIELTSSGTTFTLNYQDEKVDCRWPLIGRFNVYNYLSAIAVGLTRKEPLVKLTKIMETFPAVPGRLEAVPNDLDLKIYVDFAHSDDALANVLECLRELNTGRIITVFGCGGDRDQTKRPKMAEVCEELANLSIVTSDNPRSEDPEMICRQIVQGFKRQDSYIVELDRRAAIERAIDIATPDDIILIAGKGHETYQIFAHKTIEFDDRKVASQICQMKKSEALV
jgi:UDP-N-acetylmuramoyl-L-alanyl-D-glutamate--2,6-diaminopimelate ligase